MLLFLTSEYDAHADQVEAECERRDIPFFRFATDTFPSETQLSIRLTDDKIQGLLQTSTKEILLEEVVGIWFRRPEKPKPNPGMDEAYLRFAEMESMAALQGLFRALWDKRWVNPAHSAEAARHKIHQLRLASKIGFKTVPTIVTNNVDEAWKFFQTHGERIVYKTLRQVAIAYTDAAYGIYTSLVTQQELERHLESIQLIPCLFQQFVPKKYELRVNVIGKHVWATAIYSQEEADTELDFRHNTAACRHEPFLLPPKIEQMCLNMTRQLDLRMGNIDLIVTPENEFIFLEINPNGQWAWIERMIGFPLCTALVDELLGIDTLAKHPYLNEGSLLFEPSSLFYEGNLKAQHD